MTLTRARREVPGCPLTGTPMDLWLRVPCDWRRPGAGPGYDLFWSSPARYGQLHPRPSRAEVGSFYEVADYYTHADPDTGPAPPPRTFFERLREHLAWRADRGIELTAARLAALSGRKRPRVLDLGCGDGGLLAELRAAGCAGVGVDPDPAARRLAAGRGLEVHDGTAEELPPEVRHRCFDLVVFNHVLEHCLDPFQALASAAARLRPGGFLVAETPNNEALGCRTAGASWPWLDVPRHLNFFTAHSLRRACLAAGLAPVATEFAGYARQFQRWWLEMERSIRASLSRGDGAAATDAGLAAWGLLLRTAFSRPRLKYDSVRVIAHSLRAPR